MNRNYLPLFALVMVLSASGGFAQLSVTNPVLPTAVNSLNAVAFTSFATNGPSNYNSEFLAVGDAGWNFDFNFLGGWHGRDSIAKPLGVHCLISEYSLGSRVDFFKADLYRLLHISRLHRLDVVEVHMHPSPAVPPPCEEVLKYRLESTRATDVLKIAKIARPAPLGVEMLCLFPVGAKLVVHLPLFRVTQDFVRFAHLFELRFRCLVVWVDVWMVLARQFAVGRLNVLFVCISRNT